MKEYIKIGGALELPVTYSHAHNESGNRLKMLLLNGTQAELAAHAINSHDELVAEVERLRGEIDILNCRLEKHMERMIDRLHK